MTIQEYVTNHTERGECKCGKCADVGTKPDPIGHTADIVFFKVKAVNSPSIEEFKRLTEDAKGEFCAVNPFDGKEHSYLELGGWIGDQGLAMQYMGLGTLLGLFQLLTPITMLGLAADDPLTQKMAGAGMISVQAAK